MLRVLNGREVWAFTEPQILINMNLRQNETHNSIACLFKISLCNWYNSWLNRDFITHINIMNGHQTEAKYVSVIMLTSAHLYSEVIKYVKQQNTCTEWMNLRTDTSETLTVVVILTHSNVLLGTNVHTNLRALIILQWNLFQEEDVYEMKKWELWRERK